jgi:phosphatidylethanolamine/phosphatidyl-N-methylethanolamine N-methyltransferase
VKDEPSYQKYIARWSELYQKSNYESGLAAWFLRKSHEWCEDYFTQNDFFEKVLEVGAGTGEHIKHIRHRFNEYWLTDVNLQMLNQSMKMAVPNLNGRILLQKEDATKLSFVDGSFDRVIAAHILEHIIEPHKALREWARVIKPGGILSLVLPCDPGFAWRFGRLLGPRNKFRKAGIDYDYWMAREHINSIHNLVNLIRYYFPVIRDQWLPCKVPSTDINLFYIVHASI